MSGDVQPRKRKDKKRKKDDLGIEEPRGTAAVLGDGDVFMHSHHDHGTGGHWCAKIIFFSLLAILITLIGLIILENRGLSELEANAVESRYSGVLEGWLEDAPNDDHHDEHTLELTHHHNVGKAPVYENEDYIKEDQENDSEVQPDEHSDEATEDEEMDDNNDESNEYLEDDNEGETDDNDQSNEDLEDNGDQSNEALDDDGDNQSNEALDDNSDDFNDNKPYDNDFIEAEKDEDSEEDNTNSDEVEDSVASITYHQDVSEENEDFENERDSDELETDNDDDENLSHNLKENEFNDGENEDEEHEEEEEHDISEEVEVEKLEKEALDDDSGQEPISVELPALPEEDGDDDDDDGDNKYEVASKEEDTENEEEDEYLEAEDEDESDVVEHITALPGKPLVEVDEEESTEKSPDTLEDEEEYEKQQEELRLEEEQTTHMWLKLAVGGALLAATQAVMRRATRERDSPEPEEPDSREETPLTDRRMTLTSEDLSEPVEEILQPAVVKKSFLESVAPIVIQQQEEDEDEEKYSDEEDIQEINASDEEVEEEVEVVETVSKRSVPTAQSKPVQESKPEPESEPEEDPDDVEIIDEDQLEEELEDEEEISDVDDVELLTRLEAKYGKLPEPERPGQKYKDGGNSIDDDWPDEPSDSFWRSELDSAERELRQGGWESALSRAGGAGTGGRARWVSARALEMGAEQRRDNRLLTQAIAAYLHLLKMHERLSDKKLLKVAKRVLDRIQFRGTYLSAEPVYRLLIRRFPNDPAYRNNLTISFLMANRADLAEESLTETLKLWPKDRLALAHYGFVLKTRHNRYEEAVEAFQKALEGDTGPATEARFYYHYGDSLLLLGRFAEAHEVHKRGAALGHFLSPAQRSLYNVARLKSNPWWKIEDTPYLHLAKALEKSWRQILREAEAAKALYEKEKEGLKERGDWSQLDLFVQGREIPDRCKRAPVTCSIVQSEQAASRCRRGQVKFSSMEAGTHVRAHVGPTNCRLRMHLGLSNTKDTYIRVDKEIRQWQTGKVFMFDDSFEHEVWHNGTGTRLVLIVDVWHPSLTAAERSQLPAI